MTLATQAKARVRFSRPIRPSFVFAALLLCASARASEPAVVTEIAPGVYVRHGVTEDATAANDDAIANIGFIVGMESVAVIDPGGSLTDGQALRAAIRAATPLPIRYVVMTHVHPDHIFGAAAFLGDHPTYVGHVRLPAALAARGMFYQRELTQILGQAHAGVVVSPALLVTGTTTLDLGGRALDVTAHATAHTDNDLTVFDRSTATLWAADLLFVERIPSLDGSVLGWLRELQTLTARPAARAVPGHGPVSVPWPDAAVAETRYLSTLVTGIRAVIAKGGDIDTAVATVGLGERDQWALFDDYNGHNVTVAFKELQWE